MTYWAYSIPLIAVQLLVTYMDEGFLPFEKGGVIELLILALALASLWPSVAIGVKRWHDRNMSGWWMLIIFVPIIGAVFAFVSLGLMKGTEGENKFGEDPFIEYGNP